ncbi:MAG: DUF3616 domain-containing protein [Noviherbaspirillum sp.]
MKPDSIVLLEFDSKLGDLGKGKKLRDGLSVALQIGDTLWVANDESVSLERLSLIKGDGSSQYMYGRNHTQFALHDLLRLPTPPAGETLSKCRRSISKGWHKKTAISGW